ncbi:alkaline phosphatase family protein [Paraglaciecola sp.]|uniref:alkaline phosphatase family protein n=1 Tax=Paraglaciecola sp. TaxID=1920173 RepID=UPI0030F38DE2
MRHSTQKPCYCYGCLSKSLVFIIVNGIPADVFEIAPTPNIDAISAQGAYNRAYVGGEIGTISESPTISAVGYQSLLTGTWANKHKVYDNSPTQINYQYWDIFRLAKNHNPALIPKIIGIARR